MDAHEPPQIVFEQPSPCGDEARAEEAFRAALAPSVAPTGEWTVTMRVTRDKNGTLHAIGEITDDADAPVAHRTIERRGVECASLARAVGVWASLVLDEEVQRAIEQAPVPAPPPPAPPPVVKGWPEPAPPPEKPAPDAQLFLAHPEKEDRDVEIGISSWVMGGTSTGMIAGGSLFVVSEAGGGWFLRPSLEVGGTISPPTATGTLGAGRFDACKRIPGNYLDQRGLQLDICAGPELGFLYVTDMTSGAAAQTLPLLGIGPRIDFRGELGSALSVVVRGVADLTLPVSTSDGTATARPALYESHVMARAVVGLSWRLR